ncbi:MAG: glycoside hydrolase family 18 protein [Blastochloris sp.]|nr:glycoside hydrolase family 18 protein [Blastochloris sp.]
MGSASTPTNGQTCSFLTLATPKPSGLRGNFKQLAILKQNNPELQIIISVGSWEQSSWFSQVALEQEARIRFARSCIALMRQYGFDGIDIDWRFPVSGGAVDGLPQDRENFSLLLSEFRGQLEFWSEEDGERYLLTATAPAVEDLYTNMELERIHTDLDWINLMSYGFSGGWSDIASHHAPLYGSARDPRGIDISESYSVDGAVNAFLDIGVPASKIVVGIPFYAQAFSDVRPNDYFGLFQDTSGVPNGTRPGGVLYFRDLEGLLQSNEYVRFFDEESKAAWMYSADRRIGISYENRASILNKVAYVRSMGLGGVMIWELSFDDADHSLLEAVASNLNPRVGE